MTMDSVPAYLRGGHIIARKERARRSTAAMHADPVTLVRARMQAHVSAALSLSVILLPGVTSNTKNEAHSGSCARSLR